MPERGPGRRFGGFGLEKAFPTSTLSTWNCWVKRLHLHASVLCPEPPIDGRRRGVTPRLPVGDLDLRHVEPPSVLGRLVNFEAVREERSLVG